MNPRGAAHHQPAVPVQDTPPATPEPLDLIWPAARELPCCGAMTPHESCACNASWVPVVTR